MTSLSDGLQFFSSAKGRLNRLPYNIALIISGLIFLAFGAFFVRTVVTNVERSTVLRIAESAKNVCIEETYKQDKNIPTENDVSNILLKDCIERKMFEKLLDLNPRSMWILLVPFLCFLAMICPTIRRFHDRSKSGWWYLGFTLASAIPFITIIALIWFLVETSFLRGTAGPNDYGPDPIA